MLSHCNLMDCSTPGFLSITNSQSLLKLMSIKLVMSSNNLILCRHLLLLSSIFPSIRVFSSESVLHIRWPKYWNFSIKPSNEYTGLISFRNDWFYLLAIQGTLKSLLQHHSSKASILGIHWRNDAKAETPILSPPHVKSWLIGKDSDTGRAGGEGDDRGWDGWMASLTWWTWVWASSESWW